MLIAVLPMKIVDKCACECVRVDTAGVDAESSKERKGVCVLNKESNYIKFSIKLSNLYLIY